ncbi:cystathionine beta-lyase [Sporolactobacillus inulinus]|jgi:cystathionine beta-lyase|uniref:cysteine-S-conjugate beta-lyase n=2 Tax=Sporolactobacillus inulinus TaxID=2078 RepID=A0A4Y1ZEY4_9BACL|nr:cystathionine beta-lyase [Sporolactobacillus inulinus]KLI03169.1 cystathionine gamma-synthase [Sporolactobacillus inulinus CASD]GAY77038.1 cystathionine beta-lyase [Sporolactobacillus inulinus]GEB76652.1 cystathionine beta-lyase MetC [Sporolactobacillus inulinus]
MSESVHFSTKLIKKTVAVDPQTGAANVPVYLSSTFHQKDFDHFGKYDYTRSGNPTRDALEEAIASLEGGTRGFAFASGMAAISTAFLLLSAGDHAVVPKNVYGGTFRILTQVLGRFGIDHTFVDTTNLEEVEKAIRPNTKVIYVETPSNPTLRVTDIQAIVQLAKAHRCLTFVDNTFMTPVFQRPLDLGADLVLHSATKFISGHSDVVAGLAVAASKEIADKIYFLQNALGAVLGVQDSWLLLRGLKTLDVRIRKSAESAQRIAEFFAARPEVKRVFYPGLADHPGAALHAEQASSGGAVLSFELKNEASARAFVNHVKLPVFAVSLGAVESILSYPPKMSHAELNEEEREKAGIGSGLLRLSVGLEDAEDLIRDFSEAFVYVKDREQVTVRSER